MAPAGVAAAAAARRRWKEVELLVDVTEPALEAAAPAGAESYTGTAAAASQSMIEGSGLSQAIVRQDNTFRIVAHDAQGRRRVSGGDAFFVCVRGCGVRWRAKVVDDGDGSCAACQRARIIICMPPATMHDARADYHFRCT